MKKFIIGAMAALATISNGNAKTYNFRIFDIEKTDPGQVDFFRDYFFISKCTVEIADSAIGPDVLVDINSPNFKSLKCSIRGSDKTYEFSYGADIPISDFWNGVRSPGTEFGLLFDSDAQPLRFDSPQIAGESGASLGFYDSPEPGFSGFTAHSFFGLAVDDDFDEPLAVLLEEARIGNTLRPIGAIVRANTVPPGTQIGLINGDFIFDEQTFRDDPENENELGERIPNPLRLSGYYTFDEQLVTPSIRITQAVFDENEPIKLVHERTTAVLLNRGPLFSDRKAEFSIVDGDGNVVFPKAGKTVTEDNFEAIAGSQETVFYCKETVTEFSDAPYCNLIAGKEYIFRVQLDDGNLFEQALFTKVIDTNLLGIEFIFLSIEGCENQFDFCGFASSSVQEYANDSVDFLQGTFPVQDGGIVNNKEVITSIKATPREDRIPNNFLSAFSILSLQDRRLKQDIEVIRKISIAQDIPVVFVPDFYFGELGFSASECGLEQNGVSFVNLNTQLTTGNRSLSQVVAHEVGHSLGLFSRPQIEFSVDVNRLDFDFAFGTEAYTLKPPHGFPAEGFDVYKAMPLIKSADTTIHFMGSCDAILSPAVDSYWVNADDWGELTAVLAKSRQDPEVLLVAGEISIFGNIEISTLSTGFGIPKSNVAGDFEIKLFDANGVEISTTPFSPERGLSVEPLGSIFSNSGFFVVEIEYPIEAYEVRIQNSFGVNLVRFDPATTAITDLLVDLNSRCLESNGLSKLELISDKLSELNTYVLENNTAQIDAVLLMLEKFLSDEITDNCDLPGTEFQAADRFLEKAEERISHLRQRHGIDESRLVGDFDFDGDVDRNDLNILMASRNQPASGPDDPKDLDGDGRITGLDARKLTQLCTRPRCAVE